MSSSEGQAIDSVRRILDRSAPKPSGTLPYGDREEQVADVWMPRDVSRRAPLIILWHGGFWRQEWDRTHLRRMASALAAENLLVLLPEYRRTGGSGGWPATFADVAIAADTLPGLISQRLPTLVDLSRIVFAGHSAGGHLAVWAARDRRQAAIRPTAVVALAPVLDLAEAYRLDLDGGGVAALLGGAPEAYPDRYATADPMRLGAAGPPITIVHGDEDRHVPIALSRRYRDEVGAELIELPGVEHFALIDPEAAAGRLVMMKLLEICR